MEAKGSSWQFLAYNTYVTPLPTNPLFPGFSGYQNVNKEIITEITDPRQYALGFLFTF